MQYIYCFIRNIPEPWQPVEGLKMNILFPSFIDSLSSPASSGIRYVLGKKLNSYG